MRRRNAGQLQNAIEDAEHRVLTKAGLADEQHPRASSQVGIRALAAAVADVDPTFGIRADAIRLKRDLLAELGCVCEICGEDMGSADLIHLHHVVPVSRGGTNRRDNVVLACPNDHARAHRLDRILPEAERPCNRRELIAMLRCRR